MAEHPGVIEQWQIELLMRAILAGSPLQGRVFDTLGPEPSFVD
jgi:hypothetical protein